MMRCVIIDDEPLARRQIRAYVGRIEGVESVGEFGSSIDADRFLREESVDLIFCDINMPEQSGLEFVSHLQERYDTGLEAPMVIFTTAHCEYALEGFRLEAVDYLLKPLSFADFSRSIIRAQSLYRLKRVARGLDEEESVEVSDPLPEEQYITVKAGYKSVPIKINDILYLESEGEYVRFNMVGGRKVTTFYRLKNMEAELPSSQFVRIHRSYIINLHAVVSYERGRVFISESDYLPIGQSYREHFLGMMAAR